MRQEWDINRTYETPAPVHHGQKGPARRGVSGGCAGDCEAGKAIDPVLREIEGQQDGPVTVLCGDEDPVARATVHSPTGSWDIGGSGDKGLSCRQVAGPATHTHCLSRGVGGLKCLAN